jgi:hypothetical protein
MEKTRFFRTEETKGSRREKCSDIAWHLLPRTPFSNVLCAAWKLLPDTLSILQRSDVQPHFIRWMMCPSKFDARPPQYAQRATETTCGNLKTCSPPPLGRSFTSNTQISFMPSTWAHPTRERSPCTRKGMFSLPMHCCMVMGHLRPGEMHRNLLVDLCRPVSQVDYHAQSYTSPLKPHHKQGRQQTSISGHRGSTAGS